MAIDLSTLLENRRWIFSTSPFPHVRANDIFRTSVYRTVEQAFSTILSRGFAAERTAEQFSRMFREYDAYGAKFPSEDSNPLRVFLSREWHDLLAELFNVKATGDVNAELHHHPIDSAHGRIHNDLNPGWFVHEASLGSVNLSDNDVCSYKFGECKSDPQLAPKQRIRAVAMLYYLVNTDWTSGDGGETGLYEFGDEETTAPQVAIPPINNSLVAFEVTPYSFHSFLKNKRSPRNAILLWLHRSFEETVSRWGKNSIVYWSKKNK
jgi:2OG-Fe(II) oxygenase superfamily